MVQAASPWSPDFNIVFIRMMVSATSHWLAYTILSFQQQMNSSVMKLPVVPTSMQAPIIEHLLLDKFSKYFTHVFSVLATKPHAAGLCVWGTWVSSERLNTLRRSHSYQEEELGFKLRSFSIKIKKEVFWGINSNTIKFILLKQTVQ